MNLSFIEYQPQKVLEALYFSLYLLQILTMRCTSSVFAGRRTAPPRGV